MKCSKRLITFFFRKLHIIGFSSQCRIKSYDTIGLEGPALNDLI